eukprot:6405583-Amphidinium_carterae.1
MLSHTGNNLKVEPMTCRCCHQDHEAIVHVNDRSSSICCVSQPAFWNGLRVTCGGSNGHSATHASEASIKPEVSAPIFSTKAKS